MKRIRHIPYYIIVAALMSLFLLTEVQPLQAQQKEQTPIKELPKALQRRQRARTSQDNFISSAGQRDSLAVAVRDTIPLRLQAGGEEEPVQVADSLMADSIARMNEANMQSLDAPVDTAQLNSKALAINDPQPFKEKKAFVPDPAKATWLAVIFPGGGQIYNRKYWKLPIVYGGFVGCAYALTWNGQMYDDYSQAYLDIMDDNPDTDSYLDLLPPGYNVDANMDYLKKVIKRKKDSYRRYRDLSIFCFIGVYIVSIIDAYVDAELANFDISKDLSMKMRPTVINNNELDLRQGNAYGVRCSLNF